MEMIKKKQVHSILQMMKYIKIQMMRKKTKKLITQFHQFLSNDQASCTISQHIDTDQPMKTNTQAFKIKERHAT